MCTKINMVCESCKGSGVATEWHIKNEILFLQARLLTSKKTSQEWDKISRDILILKSSLESR